MIANLDLPIATASWASAAMLAFQQVIDPDGTFISLRIALVVLGSAVVATWHFTRTLSKLEHEIRTQKEEIRGLKSGRRHTDADSTEG